MKRLYSIDIHTSHVPHIGAWGSIWFHRESSTGRKLSPHQYRINTKLRYKRALAVWKKFSKRSGMLKEK